MELDFLGEVQSRSTTLQICSFGWAFLSLRMWSEGYANLYPSCTLIHFNKPILRFEIVTTKSKKLLAIIQN
ncbi:unnamed protein product [Lupinus luteus]|uniref:Uncharacterized protein n=1 Tax=Lupinus luteus TaxID=3873 RepID=A0AAV1Y2L5_LUPLU